MYNFLPLPAVGKGVITLANPKTGFILYFDNYPILASLPMEQRGLLFSALMVYADRVWREPSVTLEEVLDGFPKLSHESRMACSFMAAAVFRDTMAWLDRQQSREKKRQAAGGATPSPAADQRAREDMERTRRLMEQMKREETATPAPHPAPA